MAMDGAPPVTISAADRGKLDLFLAALDQRQVHIGVRESLRAHELFLAAAESAAPASYARAMFTSLLARNPAEQRQIAAEFDLAFLPAKEMPPPQQPRPPPKPGSMARLAAAARRIDPAWIGVFLSVAAALAIGIWLMPGAEVTPVVKVEPPPIIVVEPPPDSTVPKPEVPDGVWTTDALLQDIDRLISEGKLSAAPTLRELRKAGWPPPELRGGIPMSLTELVQRGKLPRKRAPQS